MSRLFDRPKMTSATSELFISPEAAQAMKNKPKPKTPKSRRRRGQGGRR